MYYTFRHYKICKRALNECNVCPLPYRLYDISSPLKPVQTHRLGSHATSFALSSSHSTFDAALGEIAIAFDFGPPSVVQSNTTSRGAGTENLLYPVFILRGNGDIYVLNTSLTDVR